MEKPLLLSNSDRSDRLLKTKLGILKKTLRVRGVEVLIIKSDNSIYKQVHGYNNIDLDGDRADETKTSTTRLIIDLNELVRVGEKGSIEQVCYHYDDIANEGDIVVYRNSAYEYAFKVSKKTVYGENDFIYEYSLNAFRVIKKEKGKKISVEYGPKPIDLIFKDHKGTPSDKIDSSSNPPKDWRQRISELDLE